MEDILYTRALVGDMKDQYKINNVYFIGHSNDGVFALLLALYTPNMFKGIVSHMGCIWYDPDVYFNFKIMRDDDYKTPLLFYTGENDLHKIPCEIAYNIDSTKRISRSILLLKKISVMNIYQIVKNISLIGSILSHRFFAKIKSTF